MNGKSRYISRLTDKEIAIKVFEWLQTDEGNQAFRQEVKNENEEKLN